MIIVRESDKGEFEHLSLGQNPIVYSLDGTEKTRLNVLMSESWTDEDRARFGIHKVEPPVVPEGMMVTENPRLKRGKDGKVAYEMSLVTKPPEPEPQPSRLDMVLQQLEELNARVALLEDEKKARDAGDKRDARD